MAHESFEHEPTAAVMNELFVNIKVDREERPDVDAIYMDAVQAIAGQGGWPMTVFLTPDGRPFFGGTYFPRDRFVALLRQVAAAWTDQRGGPRSATPTGWPRPSGRGPGRSGTPAWAAASRRRCPLTSFVAASRPLAQAFDPEWGGFGRAPKFPQPTMVELLLRTGPGDGSDRPCRW